MQKFEFWLDRNSFPETGYLCFVEMVRGDAFPKGVWVEDTVSLLEDFFGETGIQTTTRLSNSEVAFLNAMGIVGGGCTSEQIRESAISFLKQLRNWRTENPVLGPLTLQEGSPLRALEEEVAKEASQDSLESSEAVASEYKVWEATGAVPVPFPTIVRETVKKVHFVDEFVLEDGIRLEGLDAEDLVDIVGSLSFDDLPANQIQVFFGRHVLDYLLKYQIVRAGQVFDGITYLEPGPNQQSFCDAFEKLCAEVD